MIPVIYWSGTGNTEAMANAIAEGIREAGEETKIIEVDSATEETVASAEKIAFGCPAMGAEELEEASMRPFMDDVNPLLKGKKILLFGSYDWADGEWMETWEDEVRGQGASYIDTVIAKGEPDGDAVEECKKSARALCEA
ncbi:flavodoxin [Aedoeadaptatus nemausensis]|uniref:Flavodoxin n=1 Tax=Aedoeadaptatus nemausensis TaxID=2582829 RepID=A0A6V6Y6X8_9FIRM|nr:flavodoxin [Peptoniphilus nemausensis]